VRRIRVLQWANTSCGSPPNWSLKQAELHWRLAAHSLSARCPFGPYCRGCVSCSIAEDSSQKRKCRGFVSVVVLCIQITERQLSYRCFRPCATCKAHGIIRRAVQIRTSRKLQLGSYKVCVVSRDLGLILIGDDLCVRDAGSAAVLHITYRNFFCF